MPLRASNALVSLLLVLVLALAGVVPVQAGPMSKQTASTAAFAPVTVELYVNPGGSFDKDGNAILRGTLTCSHLVYIWMGGTAEQATGHKVVRGGFDIELSCEGMTSWEAVIHSDDGRFRAGWITVLVDGHGYVLDETADDTWVGFVAPAVDVRLNGKK